MDVAVIGSPANDGTAALVEHWRALGIDTELVGAEGVAALRPPTIAVVRLDVVPSLDGVEPGLVAVLLAERRGLEVAEPRRGDARRARRRGSGSSSSRTTSRSATTSATAR